MSQVRHPLFAIFCKNDRGGGGGCIFPELGEVLGCHMQNFRSLAQSLHIDNFCKNEGGGGGGGAPIFLNPEKACKFGGKKKLLKFI